EELRGHRPTPRPELVQRLTSRLQREPHASAGPPLRYRAALAVAMTALLLVAAAVVGGLSYASATTSHTVHTFSSVFKAADPFSSMRHNHITSLKNNDNNDDNSRL